VDSHSNREADNDDNIMLSSSSGLDPRRKHCLQQWGITKRMKKENHDNNITLSLSSELVYTSSACNGVVYMKKEKEKP
jgi:hypothetical protein